MIVIRDRHSRGQTKTGWLDSRHTFSFGDYRDPEHMGFRTLRVINEDRVIPGAGFGAHSHRDMEIISFVLSGELEHKDNLGNSSVIRPGEVQRMSAGTGITHSEFNPNADAPVHFLQIWLLPDRQGLEPGYEQKLLPAEGTKGRLRLMGDRNGTNGAITIHQDVRLYVSDLTSGEQLTHQLPAGRFAWLQVARGTVELNGDELREGDGAAISNEPILELASQTGTEFLLFDLA